MGIQINGNTDTITAIDGALTVSGAELTGTSNINVAGIITATRFVGNLTGNVNSSGVSTFAASAPSITPTGDSNTGIFFPSADTIAFAEGGVETARFDSSGQLGIGTNAPSAQLHVFRNTTDGSAAGFLLQNTGTTGSYATLINTAGSVTSQLFADAGGNAIGTPGVMLRTTTNHPIIFGTNNIDRGRFDTSGNLQIANGNLVFSTAGKGIDFSATANSSGTMTSELLADYEEGTWTPGISDSATGTKTVSGSQGWYTKIGRMVYLGFALNNLNSSTSGDSYITGIPFTSAAINQVGTCFIADVSGVTYASGYSDIYGRINSSTNAIQLLQKTINGNAHDTMSGGSLGTGLVLRGMCMYIV
jgi:hypothetical protein